MGFSVFGDDSLKVSQIILSLTARAPEVPILLLTKMLNTLLTGLVVSYVSRDILFIAFIFSSIYCQTTDIYFKVKNFSC